MDEALERPDADQWMEAMKDEIRSMIKSKVFELVPLFRLEPSPSVADGFLQVKLI